MNSSNNIPLVTVVTPSFNQGKYIEQTILSVLSQDYPNIEYIVVDGGSTDETIDILKKYEGRLIWISEPDNGQSHAINKGFGMASGDIVSWLNSDDTYLPGAVKIAVDYLVSHPEYLMVYGEGDFIDSEGTFIRRFPYTRPFDLWVLTYVSDFILQPTAFMRREAVYAAGMVDERLHWCMDWDLWLRIGNIGFMGYIPNVLANARVYPETKTSQGGLRRLCEIVSMLRRYGRKMFPLAFWVYGGSTIRDEIKAGVGFFFPLIRPILLFLHQILRKKMETYQGVYQDGWLGKHASYRFPASVDKEKLVLSLIVPNDNTMLGSMLTIKLNGKKIQKVKIDSFGKMVISVPITGINRREFDLDLLFSRTINATHGNRNCSCFVTEICFQ